MTLRGSFWSLTSFLIIIVSSISTGKNLYCNWQEYQNENICCRKCSQGQQVKTDCKVNIPTSCKPCPLGTFMNEMNAQKSCFPCSECEEAPGLKTKRRCMPQSDSTCEPLERFFCTQSVEGSCGAAQKHRSCDPGHYIRQRGTSVADTVCSPCANGTFSDGTLTSCQKHRECHSLNQTLLRPGTKSRDAECVPTLDRTIVIAVGGVVVFLLCCILGLCYHRKRITGCLNRGAKGTFKLIEMQKV